MTALETVAEMRRALAGRERVALVPTMGFLHDGHLSLIRRAREECETVVVSIFVNPKQFGEGEDLDAYPRDPDRDLRLAAEAGADLVFVPSVAEIYPDGFSTAVEVHGVTDVLCGAARPGHFAGVATVVTKLFNIVGPDIAYFGQKDAQQAIVIRKLVTDLNMPVRVAVCPTVREPDGLAMSSRNAYLSADERERARGLSLALRAAEDAVARGGDVLGAAREQLERAGIEPEYLELRSAKDLTPVERVNGSTLLAVAAQVGRARLIDNTILTGDK